MVSVGPSIDDGRGGGHGDGRGGRTGRTDDDADLMQTRCRRGADVVQMMQMGEQMRDTANVYGQNASPTVHNFTGPYY